MHKTHMPETDHVWFDTICAELDEDQPLPSVVANQDENDSDEERAASLNQLILAGLVSPY